MRSTSCATFLLLVTLARPATANVGPPWRAGDRVGEPNGLQGVVILCEHLTIDLRPLRDGKPAIVEAVYEVYNKGNTANADLLFVAGSPIGDRVEVRLNAKEIGFARQSRPSLPETWKVPETTPRIGAGADIHYKLRGSKETVLAFTISLPPGEHSLRVRYEAEASAHASDGPTRYWQLAYILAPARAWGGFGDLHVSVYLPPGWAAASDPELKRDGDEMTGTFNSIPADALRLTVQSPARVAPWMTTTLATAGGGTGLLGGMVLCWRWGAARGHRLGAQHRSSRAAWPISLLAAVLWAGLILGAVFLTVWLKSLDAPAHQESIRQGYEYVALGLLGSLIALLALPVGVALSQIAAYRACNRSAV